MPNDLIPISQPLIGARELEYVTDAVRSGWISSIGEYIERFEREFARFCGTKHAVAVGNGTVALHLALVALGLKEGDEVIIPDLTFIATANVVRHFGGTPIFVDIEEESLCLDPRQIEARITPRTKAIIPVHLYGHPANMLEINRVAKKRGLVVIEDAAEAHGASIGGTRVGSLGHCGVFSFYGNKIVTTGEGGMITTDDPELDRKARYLRDHAMSKTKRYWHTEVGYNYRMTNLQAALGVAQMERVDEFISRRKQIQARYQERLGDNPKVRLNRRAPWAESVYWMICAEFADFTRERRDALIVALRERGVDSRPYFYPCSEMPMYKSSGAHNPVSIGASSCGINLPIFVQMTDEQVDRVCGVLIEALATV